MTPPVIAIVTPDSSTESSTPETGSVPTPIAQDLAAQAQQLGQAQAEAQAALHQRNQVETERDQLREQLVQAENRAMAAEAETARLQGLVAGALLASDTPTPEPPTPPLSDDGPSKTETVHAPPALTPANAPGKPRTGRGTLMALFHGRR
jgi:uncharacterized membrane protein YccC